MNVGEVWYADFPLEENPDKFLIRPVIVLDADDLEVLSVKVTKKEPRKNDEYDTPIIYWKDAKLRFKSTARVAKTIRLPRKQFKTKMGDLHKDDLKEIQEQFMKFIDSQEAN